MTWFIQTHQRTDEQGKPIGLFKLTAQSDESNTDLITGLCDHDHTTAKEANNCPDANRNAESY